MKRKLTEAEQKRYSPDAGTILRNRLASDCYPSLKLTMSQRAELTDLALAMSRKNASLARLQNELEGFQTQETLQLLTDTKR
jgi:hypothetical protein